MAKRDRELNEQLDEMYRENEELFRLRRIAYECEKRIKSGENVLFNDGMYRLARQLEEQILGSDLHKAEYSEADREFLADCGVSL